MKARDFFGETLLQAYITEGPISSYNCFWRDKIIIYVIRVQNKVN